MEKILEFIKTNRSHPLALIGGFILILGAFISVDWYLELFIKNTGLRLSIYIFLCLTWWVIWWKMRIYMPRNKDGFIGVVISIRTEQNEQQVKIKNDFIRRINELANQNNLGDIINIIFLNQHQSERLIKTISKGLNTDNKRWLKTRKRIKAHFYIHGDVKERKDGEDKFFLNLNAFVIHEPISGNVRKRLKQDFDSVWFNKINFVKNFELRGFELTAELIFIGATYVIGLAALLSRDLELAIRLHKSIIPELEKLKPLPPNLKNLNKRLSHLLADEYQLLSRRTLEKDKNFASARQFLDESFKFTNKNYGGLLLLAIIQFLHDKNPQKSLQTISRAKSYSLGDGTWKYSKGFLLMHLEKFNEGYIVYEKIANNSFVDEDDRVNQVIKFNEDYLLQHPEHIQSFFINAYLELKKKNNLPRAYDFFEKFMKEAEGQPKYKFLIDKSKLYFLEIKTQMGI